MAEPHSPTGRVSLDSRRLHHLISLKPLSKWVSAWIERVRALSGRPTGVPPAPEPVEGFACSADDFSPYVLPELPPHEHFVATDEEAAALALIAEGCKQLRTLGWREIQYAPRDGTDFLSFVAGGGGIWPHSHWGDFGGGGWHMHDGDTWPAYAPPMFKPIEDHPRELTPARFGGARAAAPTDTEGE